VKRSFLFLAICLAALLTMAGAPVLASTRHGLRVEADTRSG
jgi:hypothetical protein